MSETEKALVETALGLGAGMATVIPAGKLQYRREFRQMCEANSCGKYGKCWMCPPDVGPIDSLIEAARERNRAFVFQTVGTLEDSFDIEGMEAAAKAHNGVLQQLCDTRLAALQRPVVLGAGACHVCEACTKPEGKPCRAPDKAVSSLESYGIAVSELAAACGMKYINGENTVTYFAAILFEGEDADV